MERKPVVRISTTVSYSLWQRFHNWNSQIKKREDLIQWAECVRRGFQSLIDDKSQLDLSIILSERDYVSIKIKDRISKLCDLLSKAHKQIEVLQQKIK